MRVKKTIGAYNHNLGGVPGHISGRRADPIPVGAVVEVTDNNNGWLTVRWTPPGSGSDSYGNAEIFGDVGLAGHIYLEAIAG